MREPPVRTSDDQLARRVFAALQGHHGRGVRDLARELGCKQAELKACLETTLHHRVWRDAGKRWHLRDWELGRPFSRDDPCETELTNLNLYFRDCVRLGSFVAVCASAAADPGEAGYVELGCLPMEGEDNWWARFPAVQALLGLDQADQDTDYRNRDRRIAWIGYPVLLAQDPQGAAGEMLVQPVMLWAINTGDKPGDVTHIESRPPVFNGAFLQTVAVDDGPELARQAQRLAQELGLDGPSAHRQSWPVLARELHARNPDWNWREPPDPDDCMGPMLGELTEGGIYNRCVVIVGQPSAYTRGLELELGSLSRLHRSYWEGTALGSLVLEEKHQAFEPGHHFVEVVPTNEEQHNAVKHALRGRHVAISGPPGTGKSQTEINLMANVLMSGGSFLLASKNHKAVGVVEQRFNALAGRPVLYRHGPPKRKLETLAEHLKPILRDASHPVYEDEWQEAVDELDAANRELAQFGNALQRWSQAHAQLARMDEQADEGRQIFGAASRGLNQQLVEEVRHAHRPLETVARAAEYATQGVLTKIFWPFICPGRLRAVEEAASAVRANVRAFGMELPQVTSEDSLEPFSAALGKLQARVPHAWKILAFRTELAKFKSMPTLEEIFKGKAAAAARVVEASERVWELWVRAEPQRLGDEWLSMAREFLMLMQQGASGSDANGSATDARLRDLHRQLLRNIPGQAVTSLSARSSLPLKEARFDFLIVDEASQCDIASTLPLLFRAKHSVVFGDPQQLPHVTSLGSQLDDKLMSRRGLDESQSHWKYSETSLFDLVASHIGCREIHMLLDHHRCHADIAQFVSKEFYGGRLRIATRHSSQRRPHGTPAGITWQDVKGLATSPPGQSGAINWQEAQAVVAYLEELLLKQGFDGTVGVVTPFRAQADLLTELIEAHPGLSAVREKAALQAHTAHRFQADERDVIVMSPVISQGIKPGLLNYLRGTRELFNVAITRARGLLHVVGDREKAASCNIGYLSRFVEHVGNVERHWLRRLNGAEPTLGPTYPILDDPERVTHWEKVLYEALYAEGLRPIPRYWVEHHELQFFVLAKGLPVILEVDVEHDRVPWTREDILRAQVRDQRLDETQRWVRRVLVCELRDDPQRCVREFLEWVDLVCRRWR
jgi:hypothetical protein